MKTLIAALVASLLLCGAPCAVQAQAKIGWFNSAAVMDKLPEAQDAQRQLDNLVADWQDVVPYYLQRVGLPAPSALFKRADTRILRTVLPNIDLVV